MRPILGWVFLAMAAMVVALGIWDMGQLAGPPLPAGTALLETTPQWYLQAGYLGIGAVLTGLGAWLLLRGPRPGGGAT
ncbi:MAG: hypothetical protein H0T44_14650 [Gemmatimonadales bacterium]|nr:hypothetical protein [Gemmatimonadales bacterium]MDQ3426765.1 hypothetical protein [Gemmatimonadota bacterium]